VTTHAVAVWSDRATAVGGALITLGAIVWSFDLPLKLGALVYTEQFIAAVLGLALAVSYLRWRQGAAPRWHRIALATAALGAGAWLAIRYPTLQADVLSRRGEAITLAVVLLALLLDACRRSAGIALAFVFAFFFAYALLGPNFPGMFQTKEVSVFRLLTYLALDTSSMLGVALIIACTTVIAFIFFGKLLQVCGGGEFFTDLSSAAFGRYRGGSGKVEVVASALFGTISGSAVANVMSTGIITIPSMKKAGYAPSTAGAIEAVSSTGGQIMPPVMGAAAFLMAENLQVPYAQVALAALVPALLFYVSVFVQVDYEAARRGIGGIDPARLPEAAAVLRQGWFFLIPFVVLFYLMFSANMQAEEAVLWGAAVMAPLAAIRGYNGRRLTVRGVLQALAQTGRDAVEILVVCAVAGCVIGLVNITGLALGLSLSLVKLGEDSIPLLLVAVAAVCTILGMGLPTTGVYLLVALLAAPPLVKLGVPPMAAHMFVFFYGCLSMITPPVAMAAYAAAQIAQAPPIKLGWRACQLGWPAFLLPFIFVWSPTLLLIGEPLEIAIAVASATIGVWLGSAAIAGYLLRPLGALQRLGLAAAALMLIVPGHGFPGARWVDLAGAALAAFVAWREMRARDAAPPPGSMQEGGK
jgi:TRAP transporter 4TM/12TM fusion protein